MKRVKYLRLPQRVNNDDMDVLEELPELQVVSMCRADVEWKILRHLNKKTMRRLFLTSSSIRDDALNEIGYFTNLQYLSLCGTKLTDDGLRALSEYRLADLRVLSLEGVPVTDKGVRELAKMPGIERLNLFRTRCDDATIEILAGFPALRHVALGRSRITDAGVSELRRLRPALDIDNGD